jgi:hypothetical protein
MTVLDNGQFTFNSPVISLTNTQSAFIISQSISQSAVVGAQVYGVNITPTFFATTASQTETAFRVAATFTGSAAATAGNNIIADLGATSVGSQFTVTDVTSGSIYMVNDVSGLPILEATSDWTVNMYNFPSIIFQKTGSRIGIGKTAPSTTLDISGSTFITGSLSVTGGITGSFSGSGTITTSSFALTASNVLGGTTSYVPLWNTNTSLGSSVLFQSGSNIGIGNIPQSGFKLDVNGQSVLRGAIYTNGPLIDYGTFNFRLETAGASWLSLGGTLSVGATSSLSAKLGVRGSGATSATTALRVENTNASASLVVLDNGNVGINTGSAAYNLDVNGTARISGGLFGIGTTGNILPLVSTIGTGTVIVGGSSPITPALRMQGSPLLFWISGTQVAQFFATTGNLTLQNGGTFTDLGHRLDVSGSGRFTENLTVTGSVIATSFTGSLQGTASYAVQALSASWAPGGTPFPYTGSAQITGSLTVTGPFTVNDGTVNLIDTPSYFLNSNTGDVSIDWGSRQLVGSAGNSNLNWDADGNNGVAYLRRGYFKTEATDAVQETFSSTPFNCEGKVIQGVSFEAAVSDYNYVSLQSNGKWTTASFQDQTAKGMLGIAFGIGGDNSVLLEGHITVADVIGYSCPIVANAGYGKPIYLQSPISASTVIPTAVSSSVRILGHIYYNNTSDTKLWIMNFRPDHIWRDI